MFFQESCRARRGHPVHHQPDRAQHDHEVVPPERGQLGLRGQVGVPPGRAAAGTAMNNAQYLVYTESIKKTEVTALQLQGLCLIAIKISKEIYF